MPDSPATEQRARRTARQGTGQRRVALLDRGRSRRAILLALAGDYSRYRHDLRELLERHGFTVAGETATGAGAIRFARERNPGLTLIELSLPDIDGAVATEAILSEHPNARIVILVHGSDLGERELLDALLAGACGYLCEDAAAAEIVAGVSAALDGEEAISPAIAAELVDPLRARQRRAAVAPSSTLPRLTRRERDVLRLLAQGRENSAIAAELVISDATVKTHVAHLLQKLGVENRVQAAVLAVRHGIA